MRHAEGLVARVSEDGKAHVVVQTDESVHGCTSRTEHCHCSGGSMGLTIKVVNKAGANAGDYVSVGFVPGGVLKSVAVVLGIPLLGLISGVMVGSALVQNFVLSSPWAVVAGSACFALAVLVAVIVYRWIWAGIQPFTERIISVGLGAASLFQTIDPVCKMQVNPQKVDAKIDYKGKTYYFCNAGCLKAFTKEPEKYLGHLSCAHC